ncbi:coiled-coil domain-containing protein 115 isoform X3 [Phymastichus coffea]|uniref:coiled-coil domain-containing protein 115 isoform X3 n=1 Tax=Phymastichus coffea TaxID=108790 RepID=UPI00273BB094|nr:coiled-coil domain-containing protein 115 isoform X3 [Phymastichus coffea]
MEADKRLEEICESLDNLTIDSLQLMEEKILLNVQLENLLRQGHIDLAKARYIRGKESIGMLQIPSEDKEAKSIFNLETTFDESQGESIPHFDISLKTKSKEDDKEAQDPIKWFGLLVPQSLKSAQKHFQEAIYLTVKLANLQSQMAEISKQSESLRSLKKLAS